MGRSNVVIRIARLGCTNRPFYHLVAIKRRAPPLGQPIEQIGTYDPLPNIFNERLVAINFERLRYWLGVRRASATLPAQKLLGICGFYPIHPMTYIQAKRKRAGKQIHGVAELTEEGNEAQTSS